MYYYYSMIYFISGLNVLDSKCSKEFIGFYKKKFLPTIVDKIWSLKIDQYNNWGVYLVE